MSSLFHRMKLNSWCTAIFVIFFTHISHHLDNTFITPHEHHLLELPVITVYPLHKSQVSLLLYFIIVSLLDIKISKATCHPNPALFKTSVVLRTCYLLMALKTFVYCHRCVQM